MTRIAAVFDRYAEETAPSRQACDRLCQAVRACPTESEVAQDLLSRLPPVTGAEERALLARVRVPRGMRLHRGRALALASVTVSVVALVGLGIGLARPEDPPLSVELRSESHWTRTRPARGVEVMVQGEGAVSGSERHPRLRWDEGRVEVEVDPGSGVDLVVVTREARARVTGTVFGVSRDLLGTHVTVSRGSVETTCLRSGATNVLTASESRTCLPTTASGMLGRARALQDQGAPWQDVLDAATAGLAQDSGGGTVRSELEVLRLEALVEVGRPAEAREAARAYLASGSVTRLADVERIAAQLESSLGPAQ